MAGEVASACDHPGASRNVGLWPAATSFGGEHPALLLRFHQPVSAALVNGLAGVNASKPVPVGSNRLFTVETCDALTAATLELAKHVQRLLPAVLVISAPRPAQGVLTISTTQLERLAQLEAFDLERVSEASRPAGGSRGLQAGVVSRWSRCLRARCCLDRFAEEERAGVRASAFRLSHRRSPWQSSLRLWRPVARCRRSIGRRRWRRAAVSRSRRAWHRTGKQAACYELQDTGLDTIEADRHLGFSADERSYAAAASMLRQLGMTRIQLLTNNLEKMESLRKAGIEVVGGQRLIGAVNRHNARYVHAKRERAGHLMPEINMDEIL